MREKWARIPGALPANRVFPIRIPGWLETRKMTQQRRVSRDSAIGLQLGEDVCPKPYG